MKINKKGVAGAVALSAITLGIGGATYWDANRVELISETVAVEVGSVLNKNISNYINASDNILKDAKLDFSAVNTKKAGNYQAVITYKEHSIPFTVSVITNAPDIVLDKKIVTLSAGKNLDVNDVKLSVTNSTQYSVAFSDNSTSKQYDKEGTFTENIVVTDIDTGLSSGEELTVVVVNAVAPDLVGVHDIEVVQGEEVNLLDGVSAIDDNDGDITSSIVYTEVDTNELGAHTVTYTIEDSVGNVSTATCTVNVVENIFTACDKIMYATSSTLNIRDDYNQNATKIGAYNYRDQVHVIATIKDSNWVKVMYTDGVEGYVISDYLSDTQPAEKKVTTPSNSGTTATTPSDCEVSGVSDCVSDCAAGNCEVDCGFDLMPPTGVGCGEDCYSDCGQCW